MPSRSRSEGGCPGRVSRLMQPGGGRAGSGGYMPARGAGVPVLTRVPRGASRGSGGRAARERAARLDCRGPASRGYHGPARRAMDRSMARCLESLPILLSDLVRVRPGRPAALPTATAGKRSCGPRCLRLPRPWHSESSFRTDPSVCPIMLRHRHR